MKAAKLIVLLGGVLGICAFFLPLLAIHRPDYDGSVSGYQIIQGATRLEAISHAHVTFTADPTACQGCREVGIAIFIPALLLAVIGALGCVRRRFGRIAGSASLVLGLVGLSIAAILVTVVDVDTGIALEMLLLASIAGFCGGMLAIVSPEGKLATAWRS